MKALEKDFFSIVDYGICILMLAISTVIGIYYGYLSHKSIDTAEFLMGGRQLSVFPVAMSLFASFASAIGILGVPAEIYRFGSQFIMLNIAYCLAISATAYLYLPVFHNIGITSANEYLELRFSRFLRTFCTIVYCLIMLMMLSTNVYAPALTLAEVSGLNMWISVFSIGLVCTFYTSVGGMKAVVITDLLQAFLIFAAIFVIAVKGTYDIGGIAVVWERSVKGQRIEFFNFSLNPTTRNTFWSLSIGGFINYLGVFATVQPMVQRYLTVPTIRDAQSCIWICLLALVLYTTVTCLIGLLVYAHYSTCDPIGVKIVETADQLFPRFVMETLGNYPGIPGLFISGIFGGSLSSISSGVNSLATMTLEDIIKVYIVKDIGELWATRVTKLLAMIYGFASIALVFVAQGLGPLLQACMTFQGIVTGIMLGLFSLGMFFPWTNTIGASIGVVSGFTVTMWLGVGAFVEQPFSPQAPMSYENCTELFYNVTGVNATGFVYAAPRPNEGEIIFPYRLSYLWLSSIGFLITIIVGSFVSLLSGPTKFKDIDKQLLSPLVLWMYHCLQRLNWEETGLSTTNDSSTTTSKFYGTTSLENSLSYEKDTPSTRL